MIKATPAQTSISRTGRDTQGRGTRLGLRAFGLAVACAIVIAASESPVCRTTEGGLNGRFAAMMAAAAAAALTGWTARTAWARAGRWAALALAGQAAALQLIDAGPLIHFQHYRLPSQAIGDPILRYALLAFLCQALLVAFKLASVRDAIRVWLRNRRRPAILAAVVLVCGPFAAAVSRDPRFYVLEATLGIFVQLVNAANILLVVWSLPPAALETLQRWVDSWLGDRQEPGPLRVGQFALLAALWVTALSAALAYFVYERHPHVADEVVYLYNARYLATGKMMMPPPPVEPAFEVDLMEYQPDKWYGAVPLGWPVVLAAGAALGAPWLVNPVLAGLNILLAYLFLGELYPRRVARIGVLLLCVSPWNVFLAMSYMTHTVTMTCALVAFLGVARARRTGVARWALLAGLGTGAGVVVRPLDGVIAGVLAGAWAIGFGGRRLKFGALAALAIGAGLTGSVSLIHNEALTGNPLSSPLVSYAEKHYWHNANAYGFGKDRGEGWPTDAYPGHTPFEALINAELNGASLNAELFGWGAGSLLLLAVLPFSGAMRRADYLMLAAIATVLLAYAPYWGNGGPDFGARYWYLVLLPAVALSARGLEGLEEQLGTADHRHVRATAAAAALCGLALLTYFPWRALDKYHHYLRMRPDVPALAKSHRFGRSLVLVRGERFPDYASAAIYNPLDLHATEPVYAWDRSPAVRAQLMRAYPDRPVWIVEGPSITQAGYRVVAGPLAAASIPAVDSH